MNLQDTDFELFGVPATFAQDRVALDARWKELQREVHPDRFASQGTAAQRVAMQWSVRINEAYQRLKDPVRRASYLCELKGAPIEAENNTAMPGEFLMQQMEWRESLDDASAIAAVDALQAEVDAARARALSSLDWLIDEKGDFPAASQQVRALMFIERFAQDVEAKADALGQ
ncbi:Fe-S protein assembly co-chaperone HscB [Variovorax arabinosiphilus]|uniref:Fe-S protein assembly co-chaperone HscB n=1 Tax=Variovorax arabinosiphilus TaxID=3053498 RepID=UPI00257856B3|nr:MULTISPECIES: Fe-S protein assembly co-chaperone HscB [unclassified Variovorax]MDM0119866.1 Fe-S protein assembly co-chaperone HscB [Variovorax sp. J2L1-78]MDM0128222.1 Fe-S protein assembly co-chaperone HscB [Variovorax sp. J2L1-63]MDM0231922.1 Fe-S protein assembly co-chaperone HscB [Variovorax sp. J2R1-6]